MLIPVYKKVFLLSNSIITNIEKVTTKYIYMTQTFFCSEED